MAIKDTEYLYASSNIRAIEGDASYSERLKRFIECKSVDELYFAVAGSDAASGSKKEALEEYLDARLASAFSLVKKIVPDKKVYDFLIYEYDCCNLKVAIKSFIKGMSPKGMIYSFGTVPEKAVSDCAKDGDTSAFPKNMAKAGKEAIEAYEKTKDPSVIDMIVDRACFADMLENANLYGYEKFVSLVKNRIDKVNIISFMRIALSKQYDKRKMLDMALADGGTITKTVFYSKLDGFDGNASGLLEGTGYYSASKEADASITFSSLERMLDDIYLACVRDMRFVPFGAEVPCAYILDTVYEIKNIKIILAGICSSLPQEKIRERVRFGYV